LESSPRSDPANTIQERNPASAKKRRSKFSDLVFTRQFTTFDRQNVDSADSPFHGFFTLFWLGTAIYMIKLAAENWRQHGNILGSNEIMGLMFHRDVMVLGLSDGVMCGVTGFGLILQKLIFKGFLSWDRQGWIIQSVRDQLRDLLITCLTEHMSDLGNFLHRCCPWLDVIPGMAVDAHCVLCPPWSCYAHEAAQLCILYVSSEAQHWVNANSPGRQRSPLRGIQDESSPSE
jgi:hypothetical protein